jgi:hypothetical protein
MLYKWWVRLRSGVSSLRVRTSSFSQTAWEERVCDTGSDWAGTYEGCVHETEDEEHLVMRCDKYKNEMTDMYKNIGWETTGHAANDDVVFAWLMRDGPHGEDAKDRTVRCAAVMQFLRRV